MAVKPLPVHGADISHYQDGKLDLAGARKRGLRFLYHKATEGTSYVDPNFARRRAEAARVRVGKLRRLRLRFGGYHFARPTKGNAVAEAKHFLSVYRPHPGDLRPALDLEVTGGLSLAELRVWAKTFCDYVERETGAKPIVYTPFDLVPKGCLAWRPRYSNANTPPTLPFDIRQFSNGVYGVPNSFPGLGHVDLNSLRPGVKVSALLVPAKAKPTPHPVPTPPPAPEPPKHVKKARKHRVGTFNAEFGHKPVADWAKMIMARFEAQHLDVLAVEECQDYYLALEKLAKAAGHSLYGTGKDHNAHGSRNAILVRKGLASKQAPTVPGDVTTWTTPTGHPQSMPRPVVVDVEGVLYACIHGPVTAWIPKKGTNRVLEGPAHRVQAYKDFTTNLLAWMKAHPEVCVLGDWNASPATVGTYSPNWVRSGAGATFLRPNKSTGHGEIDFGIVKGATKVSPAVVVPHSAFLVPTATAKAPNPSHSDHMEVFADVEWPPA